ncbi:MAG: hypothetical protein ACXVCV_22300, partial [Polyangia bacterium]
MGEHLVGAGDDAHRRIDGQAGGGEHRQLLGMAARAARLDAARAYSGCARVIDPFNRHKGCRSGADVRRQGGLGGVGQFRGIDRDAV